MSLVKLSIENECAVLSLNSPERRNVLTAEISREVIQKVKQVEANTSIKGLIVTGEGTAFSGGGDLGDLLAASEGNGEGVKEIYSGFLAVANCQLPTIAAVNGAAVGAGINLALACDVRIAAENAKFDTRFMTIGIHPGGGNTWMLQRAVGWQQASTMLLFGEVINGQQAKEIGLAIDCVPNEQLIKAAKALVAKTRHYSRDVLISTKRSLSQTRWLPSHADAVDLEYDLQIESLQKPEAKMAIKALYNKIQSNS